MDIRLDGYTATYYQINPETGDCAYHLEATSKAIPPCPKCGGREVVVHGNRVRKTRDCGICGSAVELHIHCRRYRCKKCKETFSDAMPFVDEDGKLTRRFKVQLIFQGQLAHNSLPSFRNCIARRLPISSETVLTMPFVRALRLASTSSTISASVSLSHTWPVSGSSTSRLLHRVQRLAPAGRGARHLGQRRPV